MINPQMIYLSQIIYPQITQINADKTLIDKETYKIVEALGLIVDSLTTRF